MAGDTLITIIGNTTQDVELRFLPSGVAVGNVTIASTPRAFDKQANEWKDGATLFMRCSIWREQAEHAAASLPRGTRVIASGRLISRSWETKEGEKRTVVELDVEEIGASLKNAEAKVTKTQRGSTGSQGFGGSQGAGGAGFAPQQPAQADPWATGGGWKGGGLGDGDEGIPF